MITIISGTNRDDSNTLKVALLYKKLLERFNTKAEIIDLKELPENFHFSALYDKMGKNTEFNLIAAKMKLSEKFVFIVPEYNGSFPGVLKSFIDGLEFPSPLTNKKGALVGISSGNMAGALALSHLTDILNYLGMHVLANKPRLAKIHTILGENNLNDPFLSGLLETQARQLIAF